MEIAYNKKMRKDRGIARGVLALRRKEAKSFSLCVECGYRKASMFSEKCFDCWREDKIRSEIKRWEKKGFSL